jgi:hypothetical protein
MSSVAAALACVSDAYERAAAAVGRLPAFVAADLAQCDVLGLMSAGSSHLP